MALITFSPPYSPADQVAPQLRDRGFAVLQPADAATWIGCAPSDLLELSAAWEGLPPDAFLKDGGRYRRRRHSCFVVEDGAYRQVAHRAHWQPVEYNALHGGMQRWFEPILDETVAKPVWRQMMRALAALSQAAIARDGARRSWHIEAHQFRIDTSDGIGRPTPEGAHRDGVDLVAVFLVNRQGVKGGETRIFEAAGPNGQRFTLTEPWSVMILDDARMIHETTPIQPVEAGGWRDTLVVTCRAGGFQSE
ncbi:2OG-Fe dioxygenase family protein [Diaphorobacter ruginosibacter]|uniref:2OG-Fe dioxygenase family protein n=1 Tax=Diaphorobacter ruginosibacter TaxID=1715720 RepID=UPI00333F806C